MRTIKHQLLAVAGAFAVLAFPASQAWAAACVTGTLADYIALQAGGCTIGDKTFYDFGYTASASQGALGALPIPAGGITVDPVPPATGPAGEIGLDFVAAWVVGAGGTLDSNIRFNVAVTGGGPLQIDDASLVQAGSSFSGTGIASVSENACGPAPCSPTGSITLLTVDESGQTVLSDHTFFAPTGSLSVIKDIAVLGGTGSASISFVGDTFSQTTPE